MKEIATVLNQALGNEILINEKLQNIIFSNTDSDRKNSLWNNPNTTQQAGIVPWIRENFPKESDITEYLQRSDIGTEEKIQTLGLLSVELGRLEFLMGVLYHGGNDQSWETSGTNQGPFVNYYKGKVGNNPNTNPWCTMFSGYLKRMLGFKTQLSTQGPLIFNAGSRLDWWGTSGINLLTGQDDFSDPTDYENYSGSNIDTPAWINLRNNLNQTGLTEEQKREIVDSFLSTRITPQAGDILIINNTNNNTYGSGLSSHTTTVESYSEYKIKTIEGNKGHKVTGTTVDLTDLNDVKGILLLIRLGTEFFPTSNESIEEETSNNNQISKDDLLHPLKFMTRNLQLLAYNKNFISSSNKNALVEEMAGTNNNGGTQ